MVPVSRTQTGDSALPFREGHYHWDNLNSNLLEMIKIVVPLAESIEIVTSDWKRLRFKVFVFQTIEMRRNLRLGDIRMFHSLFHIPIAYGN